MENMEETREKTIIANVFLAGFKEVIGLMTNSIVIVFGSVNNISEAGSSLITILGRNWPVDRQTKSIHSGMVELNT